MYERISDRNKRKSEDRDKEEYENQKTQKS